MITKHRSARICVAAFCLAGLAACEEATPNKLTTPTELRGSAFLMPVTIDLPAGYTAEQALVGEAQLFEVYQIEGEGLRLQLMQTASGEALPFLQDELTRAKYKRAEEDQKRWILVSQWLKDGPMDLEVHIKSVGVTCSAEGVTSDALVEKAISICSSIRE